eukprot:TRINITY_DN11199_c0_g1_i3.p1 TRINITY_DN11199_c0_g1~~TRINITY_DN11199_c0_g1_i3.p1  ORF type:complete len:104 (+),score=4.86 TRINITY_DN11199_c0_g1_i3:964-1275(+)
MKNLAHFCAFLQTKCRFSCNVEKHFLNLHFFHIKSATQTCPKGVFVQREDFVINRNCYDFMCSPFFCCLVEGFFHAKKRELIVLDREDFDFPCMGWEYRISVW